MSYKLIDQIEDEFTDFTLGKSKDQELFVNGIKTDIVLPETATDYDALKTELLEKKLIKYPVKDEE